MRLIGFIFLIVALSTACERRGPLDSHSHQTVTLNINMGGDTGQYQRPSSFNYIFISYDDGSITAGRTKDTDVGISLSPGKYDVLVYTSDFNELDAVFYRGMDNFYTAEAYTRQTTRTIAASYDITEPDPLFCKILSNVEVVADPDGNNQLFQVKLEPRSFQYCISIVVEGIEHLRSATLQIGGMYTSVFLADGSHRDDEEGIQSVDMELRENSIYGEFWSFGPHKDKDVDNRVVLYFSNGKNTVVELDDISDKIKALTLGGEITVDQRFIIHEGDGSTGFNPGVGDWDETVVSIPI